MFFKKPIVVPELFPSGDVRFSLTCEQWDNLLSDLNNIGAEIIPSTKQYLEDCEKNVTELIAITGTMTFENTNFEITAQLDLDGFSLYVSKPNDEQNYKKLLSYLVKVYGVK